MITDLSCAFPDAEIRILPFESHSARPDVLLQVATGVTGPAERETEWLNRSPTVPNLRTLLRQRGGDAEALPATLDRWQPFTVEEQAALRELYADDLFWLTAGADGLAILTEDPQRKTLKNGAAWGTAPERGRRYAGQEGPMAQPG